MKVDVFVSLYENARGQQRAITLTREMNWKQVEDGLETARLGTDPTDSSLGIDVNSLIKGFGLYTRLDHGVNPPTGEVRLDLENLGTAKYDQLEALARSVGFTDV